jgi:hypothetical protein
MALAIILRKHLHVNRFRDLMIDVLDTGRGDNAILCSGFFQEDYRGYGYRASQEQGFAQVLKKNNIDLTTVGIYHSSWKQSYLNFRDNLFIAGVKIHAKYKPGLKWHAKVFILSHNQFPVFGIIGSSNITRRAFGSMIDFNYECDAIIWPDSEQEISIFVDKFLNDIDDSQEVIRAPYLEEINRGLTIQNRLDELKKEILESGLSDL